MTTDRTVSESWRISDLRRMNFLRIENERHWQSGQTWDCCPIEVMRRPFALQAGALGVEGFLV